VVFLADMSKRFNFGDSRKQLLFHRELGAGLKLVDTERRIEYPTLPRLAIAEQLNSEMMSEELRVLYVAMTRAKERLIITYAAPDARKAAAKLAPQIESPVPPHVLARQPGVGDILLLAALALDASALFDVRYIDDADVSEEHVSTDAPTMPAPELAEYVPFEYPHPIAPDLPSKLTVTEIKNRAADSELAEDAQSALPHERAYRRPDFITQKAALTGAERGTALHLAMRLIELRDYADAAELARELDALAQRGLMTAEQRAAADEGAILRFLRSELGRRVLAADEKFREFKFSLLTDAEEFFPGGGDDKILFQGVVDLAIREGGAFTVIDFKTDRLTGDDAVRVKTELYTPQVRAYMRALTRVTGLPAREGIIYFFDNGTAAEV
jgi:ATP-dependent helicase/nuclease subunit A